MARNWKGLLPFLFSVDAGPCQQPEIYTVVRVPKTASTGFFHTLAPLNYGVMSAFTICIQHYGGNRDRF